ncbi:MAG: nicotinate phosphoribosyltransferase [Clostridia bacterium]|nr:nicotinate phosphoribosyltransferase [Clostridia bacterium]
MRNFSLLTDLYELTMGQGYFDKGIHEREAAFDLFFRPNELISYSVAAGMEEAAQYLESLRFDKEDIAYLSSLNLFSEGFLEYLKNFKFTGTVKAVREGEIVFPNEPILTVRAPLFEAQIVETALLNFINHETLIASKASKIVREAKGDPVMEFGLRRAQGADAGVFGARAALIAGCASTSNVYAGKLFSLPVSGTMAHSWVMNFASEKEAFEAYAQTYPDDCVLLVDTYDTLLSGVPNAIEVFRKLREKGHEPKGIRIDSGDLAYLSKEARKLLDKAGFEQVKICASGDLDEYTIRSLKEQGAKINSWGVGTKLITSAQLPSLGGVYKLCAVFENGEEIPKLKLSNTEVKTTNPAYKEAYRIYDKETGYALFDYLARAEEKVDENATITLSEGRKKYEGNFRLKRLLEPLFIEGRRVKPSYTVEESRKYCKEELSRFREEYKRLDMPHIYKVNLSPALSALKKELIEKIEEENGSV